MGERVTDRLSDHYGMTQEQARADLEERVKALEAIVDRLENGRG